MIGSNLVYFVPYTFLFFEVYAVPPEVCFANFRWEDCGLPPKPVMYYWKPGSRCEVALWRGCLPNPNMFTDEYDCISTCIFAARAMPDMYHQGENEIDYELDQDYSNDTTPDNDTIDDNTTDHIDIINGTDTNTTDTNGSDTTDTNTDTNGTDNTVGTTGSDGGDGSATPGSEGSDGSATPGSEGDDTSTTPGSEDTESTTETETPTT